MTIDSIIDSDNKFAKETRDGLAYLKNLTANLENWTLTEEQDNVKLYSKKLDDPDAPPLVRGDTVLADLPPGCTPFEVATVATLPGCRKIWDDRFDQAEIKEHYTRFEGLFWVKHKAPWPISPRDFVGTTIRDINPNVCYTSMISVQDDRFPDTPKTVRGKIIISGWKVDQQGNNIGITYVNQVDLAGYIPAAFLRKLLLQIPLCAGKVRNYIREFGFVPSLKLVSNKVEFKGEDFDHDKRAYNVQLSGDAHDHEVAHITCSSKMYPKGVSVVLTGGKGDVKQDTDDNNNPRIILKNLVGDVKIIITKAN
ncbi:hypothetical protein V8B55DRAFT_1377098 [Mucor lusitanicus]|uniref:START domain-containing protein n=2 Tax=Mucor circinelloides f. lusitanicus TaxID=29924 RepID=A0A162ZUK9_MUCCL|nr:hypothetical protein FB192DRAFT_1376037 [Mucor lusitanicus]OAD07917.1 hypothetical protein MUCCIDRAFT_154789 [Mucor lusitanicus CBS 277.49]